MQTLIELYDERPLENVLGVEIFHPDKVIYVCPEGTPEHAQRQLARYHSDMNLMRAELALQRALVRIDIARKK